MGHIVSTGSKKECSLATEREVRKLIWQQSQGSLLTLCRYIDIESSHTYAADDLDKPLEQAQHQRVTLTSDTVGMSKSTVLTHLTKLIKQKSASKWVVIIDLHDHTNTLNALQGEPKSEETAVEFVLEELLKLKPPLELYLFNSVVNKSKK
jgi:hypothetical protein